MLERGDGDVGPLVPYVLGSQGVPVHQTEMGWDGISEKTTTTTSSSTYVQFLNTVLLSFVR